MSEGLICYCKRCPGKSSLCIIFLSFHYGEWLKDLSSPSLQRDYFVAIFHHSVWRRELNRGNRRMMLVLFFGFLLLNIKEVVRLDVYTIFSPLLITITLHLHSGRWWPIVFPPYGSFVTTRKDVFSEQYVSCYRI